MKRRVLMLLLLLVAGAIVNVAVAWAAAAFSPPRTVSGALQYSASWRPDVVAWWVADYPFAEQATPIEKYPDRDFGRDEGPYGDRARTHRAIGFELTSIAASVSGSHGRGETTLHRATCGWPSYSMVAARWRYEPRDHPGVVYEVVRGIAIDPPKISELQDEMTFQMAGRLLPLRPIWPGFAVNTLLYAFACWLISVPFALRGLRRRRRIKRGLCPKCAYDLRGSEAAVCPECGATVNRIAR